MGERLLRPGIRTSEKTAANIRDGGWMAQVFYDWILTLVDDYGRYDARPSILRADLFALLLNVVREADVSRCLQSCEAAGLIRLYTSGGKPYLEVLNFRQRMRAGKSRWPAPDSDCHDNVMTSSGDSTAKTSFHDNVMTMPTTTDTETDTETTTDSRAGPATVGSKESIARAEAESKARGQARLWISAECPSFLRSGIAPFSRLILRLGRERAIEEISCARADPNVGNPFSYVEAKLDNQHARNGHHRRRVPTEQDG